MLVRFARAQSCSNGARTVPRGGSRQPQIQLQPVYDTRRGRLRSTGACRDCGPPKRDGPRRTWVVMYSSKVADHIANPRNVGELDDPSGVGDVVNEVCQDRIRLSIRIEGGTLAAARVRPSGCPPTLAAASVLTELIIGCPVSEVQNLGRSDITNA